MPIILFFQIGKEFRKYTVNDYKIINDFYVFTDLRDKITRRLHKDFYKGKEGG